MHRLTAIDDLWPGDMAIIVFRWPLTQADHVLSGFVMGDDSGSAIHRIPGADSYLVIEIPTAVEECGRYPVPLPMIRGIQLTGRGEAHEAAMEGVEAFEEQDEYVPLAEREASG